MPKTHEHNFIAPDLELLLKLQMKMLAPQSNLPWSLVASSFSTPESLWTRSKTVFSNKISKLRA